MKRKLPPLTEAQKGRIEVFSGLGFSPKRIAADLRVAPHQVRLFLKEQSALPAKTERLSPDQVSAILAMARLGVANAQIAKQLHVAEWRVRTCRAEYVGWRAPGHRGYRYAISEVALRRRVREFEKQLAAELGVPLRTVQRRIGKIYHRRKP